MMSLSFCFPLDILSSALFCCGVWCMSACLPTPLSFRRLSSSPASRLEQSSTSLIGPLFVLAPSFELLLRERETKRKTMRSI